MHVSLGYLLRMIMTTQPESNFGPPMPVIELTMEQQFKLRRLEDLLPEADKTDIITLFLALQRQNYALSNSLTNLLKHWPNPQAITHAEQ